MRPARRTRNVPGGNRDACIGVEIVETDSLVGRQRFLAAEASRAFALLLIALATFAEPEPSARGV